MNNLILTLKARIKELEAKNEWLQEQLNQADEIHYDEMCVLHCKLKDAKDKLKQRRLNS